MCPFLKILKKKNSKPLHPIGYDFLQGRPFTHLSSKQQGLQNKEAYSHSRIKQRICVGFSIKKNNKILRN